MLSDDTVVPIFTTKRNLAHGMNRFYPASMEKWRMILVIGFLFFCCLPTLSAQATPVFLQPAPADTTVACFSDVPLAGRLRAIVRSAPGQLDTISISPRDSLSAASAPCTGGTSFRIWTAMDFNGDAVRQVQRIVFGAPPADNQPVIDRDGLPATVLTVDCRLVNAVGHPDSYARWLGDRRIAVSLAARAGCAPLTAIDDDAPPTLVGFDCDDEIAVTFTATDLCGQMDMVVFTYRTIDTLPPVIIGVVDDTLSLSCADNIPMPTVTVEDCDTMPRLLFAENSTQEQDGSCEQYAYDIVRTWTAIDACGNMQTVTNRLEIRDNTPPDFRVPTRQRLDCTEDPFDLDLTGRVEMLSDNCTPAEDLEVTFTDDVISDGICGDAFTIRRGWRVTDRCGNSRIRVQEIIVTDQLPPFFTPPAATVAVNCADYLNTAITGVPTNLFDNCDETVNLTFTDDTLSLECPGTFTVERTWRIFDDCQNDDFTRQTITVVDTTGPVFTTVPEDLVFTCNTGAGLTRQRREFREWVNEIGGAVFTDGCTPAEALDVRVVAAGTNDPPAFPEVNCAGPQGIVRQLFVDIIVTDLCGNTTIETMEYRQLDELPIRLLFCPESEVVPTDPGVCAAAVAFPPPFIQDQCSDGLPFQLVLRDTQRVTSPASTPLELGSVPVDPIVFNLEIDAELPVNAFTFGLFNITLENVDAEGADEFFFIYGEDGALLGTTARGNLQCETVITTDTLPAFQFSQYARDGVITLTLEPNIPAGQPGTFAVNNLCEGGTTARIELVQPVFRLTEIVYEVDIDGTGFTVVDPVDTVFTVLEAGLHQVTYRATDCGGNTDECLFTVTVEDQESPRVSCPADVAAVLSSDSCQVTLDVPLPVAVEDNCEPYTLNFEQTDTIFLPFFSDPNLGTLLAGETSVTLTQAPPNPVDSIDLDVTLLGDFSNDLAVLDFVLPDGTLLGTASAGAATCDQAGRFRLRLAGTDFVAQAVAGALTLHLRPRPVTVPPATSGDGLTPCAPAAVEEEGGTDGITSAQINVTYRALYPAFFTTGATVTPTTQTSPAAPLPRVTFAQGVTDFSYIVTDQGGNTDTCTITVTVRDTTPPVAVCQPTTVFIDPSGLAPVAVDPSAIDGGSFDNCGIDSFAVRPATFDCAQYGEAVTTTLTVMDMAGNTSRCTTIVSVAPQAPRPTATTSLCGGDTLRFFANPPTEAQPGQTIYTFRWFNPAGDLISTEEDFFIPGANEDSDGAYRVEIRGITGCEATGVVNVVVGDIPTAPVITAPRSVCLGEAVPLQSESVYAGSVRYEWFRGQPGTGVSLGTSSTPAFLAPFAEGSTSGTFYAVVFVNGCPSPASGVVNVGTTTRPPVRIASRDLEACELESATLVGGVFSGVGYEWTGPDGFTADTRIVTLENLELDAAGTYYLRTVREEGCFSFADSLVLRVLPADEPTTLRPVPTICLSDTLTLVAADATGAAYRFLGPAGQMIETTSAVLRVFPLTEAVAGDWRVSIRRNSCFSVPGAPTGVSLGVSPVASTSTVPDPICEGNDLILQGGSSLSGSTYRWAGPDGFTAEGVAPMIPEVTAAAAGDYVLSVTSPAGCVSVDTLAVTILPGITIDSLTVTSGNCLQGGEPVSVRASIRPALPEGYTYQWTGPEGTSTDAVFEIPSVSLASNGTYSLTVFNEAGCASPRFSMPVEFDFAPTAPVRPFVAGGETSVCSGDTLILETNDFGEGTTYVWSLPDGANLPTSTNRLRLEGIEADQSGVFTVRVLRNGCTSLPSEGRTITVTPFPTLLVGADDPACAGQEINFQATDIPGATYFWQGPNNFSSSLPDPTIVRADAAVHAGTYRVVASVNGCVSDTIAVAVEVRPTPRVPVALPGEAICISSPGALLPLGVNPNTATAGAAYQWSIQNGMVAVGAPTDSLTLPVTDFGLFAGGGLFDFRVSASLAGCTSALSAPVSIRVDEAGDDEADAGRDTVVCEGIYLLEAAAINSGSGRWTLVQGTGDISVANPGSAITAVSGLTEQGAPYRFAWTLSDGSCLNYATDTVTIGVTNGEEALAGNNLLACLGEEVRLGATPVMMNGSVGRWSQGLAQEILGVVITDPTDPNTTITGLQADNVYSFTWTVSSNCGVKSDNVLVNISDPTPFAGADTTVCNAAATAMLVAEQPTLGSTGRWRALDAETFVETPDMRRTVVRNLQEGENAFVWEADGGFCGDRSRDTVVVTYAKPPVPVGDTYEAPFQGAVTFDPTLNDALPAGAVVVFPSLAEDVGRLTGNGDGTFTYTAPPNFAGEVTFRYEILSTGCERVTAEVRIAVGRGVTCDAPNIFTPNNDGMNDFFVIPCLLDASEFPESQVTIYNQWGDEVFQSGRPYRNDWDGTFQGNPLPVATYFYIIDFGGLREAESGDVRIER